MTYPFTFKVAGPAGFGIKSIGASFSKIATRSGYFIYDYSEYPSLIRGGHNTVQCTFSTDPVYFTYQTTDFLIALNQNAIKQHSSELTNGAGVLYDGDLHMDLESLPEYVSRFDVPLMRLIKENNGTEVMRNIVALGASVALLGGDLSHLNDLIDEEFGQKKHEIIAINKTLAKVGFDYAIEHYFDKMQKVLTQKETVSKQIVVTANDSVAMGALAAGMTFTAIYPMTPTSNILHILAPLQEKYGFIYKQPEDEISAIGMALGASHAGARAMVATSGGGFCLMAESFGLAGMTETPIVIIEGMRGSPATGLPTWTEQGDLKMILSAHQGDFPRIVLAAGDAKEAFEMTLQAFNLADIYQTPVVVVVDKIICEDNQSFEPFTMENYVVDRGKYIDYEVENYQRYTLAPDGISTRSPVGVGNYLNANADEHDLNGYSSEDHLNRNDQMQKRMQKLETCRQTHMKPPQVFGPIDAKVTLVSWGSNKGPILEAMKVLTDVNYIHLTWMNPFPAEDLAALLAKSSYVIDIECNFTAHMRSIIREQTGIRIDDTFLRYDGRPFYPEQIIEKVKSVLSGGSHE